MIWYQHVHNMNSCCTSLFLPTKKHHRRQRKDAPISFWKLKYVLETNPPPSLWEKPSGNCSVRPETRFLQVSCKKLCVTLFAAILLSREAPFHQIHWVTLSDFQGEKCIIFVRGSIWPRTHHRGLQLAQKCKGWYMTSKSRSSQRISGSLDLYTLLTPG